MIIYPSEWRKRGQRIDIGDLECEIREILRGLSCNCIALSGGLDSSLMLYFMIQEYPDVRAFTIGQSNNHPDIKYAKLIANYFTGVQHEIYIPTKQEIEGEGMEADRPGDCGMRLFYRYVADLTNSIVSCDGIDEYMAGYYQHQKEPNEKCYYDLLRKLRAEHLIPLNINSGNIQVYLPYLSIKLIQMMSQIPLSEKVDKDGRKKLMVKMAEGRIPDTIINRRKYGFCDVLRSNF